MPAGAGVRIEGGVHLPVGDYRRLRAAVGWEEPPVADAALRAALERTWNVAARAGEELAGMGRLLEDGALYATIWDMIVAPAHQRRGLGEAILARLLERARARTIVALVATPEGRPLYERHGFRPASRGSVALMLRPRPSSS